MCDTVPVSMSDWRHRRSRSSGINALKMNLYFHTVAADIVKNTQQVCPCIHIGKGKGRSLGQRGVVLCTAVGLTLKFSSCDRMIRRTRWLSG